MCAGCPCYTPPMRCAHCVCIRDKQTVSDGVPAIYHVSSFHPISVPAPFVFPFLSVSLLFAHMYSLSLRVLCCLFAPVYSGQTCVILGRFFPESAAWCATWVKTGGNPPTCTPFRPVYPDTFSYPQDVPAGPSAVPALPSCPSC